MYKTAESVSPAHPDKLCDQISDLILDECLKQDPDSRVAVETVGGHGKIFITGEITTNAKVNYIEKAKKVLEDNKYNPEEYTYETNITKQSNNIANGVDIGGAGDQGIMVGYATNETSEMIPFELSESRKILKGLWKEYFETRDAKSQVTLKNGEIEAIVVSAERLAEEKIRLFLENRYGKNSNIKFIINPAGYWDNGGFESDAGLTGRKLMVDNYGPQVEVGGGAYSGKDYTKVDRSGAYIARYTACELLKKHNLEWVKVKIAYSIGIKKPVMVYVRSNKGEFYLDDYEKFTPSRICERLSLKQQKYYETAKWGHFGNGFVWDEIL